MAKTPSTELEAVNVILMNMGEAPVVTLDGILPLDTAKARDTLSEISEEVQTTGWFWNTEVVTLTPDAQKKINLPRNTLAVKLRHRIVGVNVAARKGQLYRIAEGDNGYTWDSPVTLRITYFLDFDEMPAAARRYITLRAARVYQARELSDDMLLREDTMDEKSSLTLLRAEENENSRRSLKESASVSAVTNRTGGFRLLG